MKLIAAVLAVIFLCGCVPTHPAISDISDTAVKVQADLTWGSPAIEDIIKEGKRGCDLYGKQITFLSKRCVIFGDFGSCLAEEYLFACH